jgi:hypothetical protein
VRDIIVLVAATGIAGTVVWRMTAGPTGGPRARLRSRVRFEDSLEVTGLPVVDAGAVNAPTGPAFAFEETVAEPPHRVWSAVRLVLLIAGVAGIGAAAIWAVAHFVNQALANKLTGP